MAQIEIYLYSPEGINRVDKNGCTILMKYMFIAKPIDIKALIHLTCLDGIAINARTDKGANALIIAASVNAAYEVYHVLIVVGCDVHVQTDLNENILDVLVKRLPKGKQVDPRTLKIILD